MVAMGWRSPDHGSEWQHSTRRLQQRCLRYASGVLSLSSTSIATESIGIEDSIVRTVELQRSIGGRGACATSMARRAVRRVFYDRRRAVVELPSRREHRARAMAKPDLCRSRATHRRWQAGSVRRLDARADDRRGDETAVRRRSSTKRSRSMCLGWKSAPSTSTPSTFCSTSSPTTSPMRPEGAGCIQERAGRPRILRTCAPRVCRLSARRPPLRADQDRSGAADDDRPVRSRHTASPDLHRRARVPERVRAAGVPGLFGRALGGRHLRGGNQRLQRQDTARCDGASAQRGHCA